MAKIKPSRIAAKQSENAGNLSQDKTLLALQENFDLWYKILVLLHDLHNIAKDPTAEARTLSTTDELYISTLYFSDEEAVLIKSTVVAPPILHDIPEFEGEDFEPGDGDQGSEKMGETSSTTGMETTMIIEETIKTCLQRFFEKRKASGDARPCGSLDMGPIYRAVFGVTKEDLKDEKFLSRLKRVGLESQKPKGGEEGADSKTGRGTETGKKR